MTSATNSTRNASSLISMCDHEVRFLDSVAVAVAVAVAVTVRFPRHQLSRVPSKRHELLIIVQTWATLHASWQFYTINLSQTPYENLNKFLYSDRIKFSKNGVSIVIYVQIFSIILKNSGPCSAQAWTSARAGFFLFRVDRYRHYSKIYFSYYFIN